MTKFFKIFIILQLSLYAFSATGKGPRWQGRVAKTTQDQTNQINPTTQTNQINPAYNSSCAILPLNLDQASLEYIKNQTIYGYIKGEIGIDSTNCGDGDSLIFYVRDSQNSYTAHTLTEGSTIRLNELTTNNTIFNSPEAGSTQLFVEKILNPSSGKICLMIYTSRGKTPIICNNTSITTTNQNNRNNTVVCPTTADSCSLAASTLSKSYFNFSGKTYQCLKESLHKIFFQNERCLARNRDGSIPIFPFGKMQEILRKAIFAALNIFVIMHGFKIVLGQASFELKESSIFVMKMIFVLYFSLGMYDSSMTFKENGVTRYLLPILLQTTTNFAQIILSASQTSTLCNFDPSTYQAGYGYYALFDGIDCRIANYLGLQPGDKYNIFSLLLGFLFGGNVFALILTLVFIILFMSIIIQFLSVYLVCIIALYILMYLAPIFVPMILFQKTKSYFDSWLKLLISFSMQPILVMAFLAFILSIFDKAMYGGCTISKAMDSATNTAYYTISSAANSVASAVDSTVNAVSGSSSNAVSSATSSVIANGAPSSNFEACSTSSGFTMRQLYKGQGWNQISLFLIKINYIPFDIDNIKQQLYLCIFCFIFYFLSQQAVETASGITGGPSLSDITVSLGDLVNKIQERADKKAEKKDDDAQKAKKDS